MMSNNGQQQQIDPIEQARQQQLAREQAAAVLFQGLHIVLQHTPHVDVMNASMSVSAARAKMGGITRAQFRNLAGQVFDAITITPNPDGNGLIRPDGPPPQACAGTLFRRRKTL